MISEKSSERFNIFLKKEAQKFIKKNICSLNNKDIFKSKRPISSEYDWFLPTFSVVEEKTFNKMGFECVGNAQYEKTYIAKTIKSLAPFLLWNEEPDDNDEIIVSLFFYPPIKENSTYFYASAKTFLHKEKDLLLFNSHSYFNPLDTEGRRYHLRLMSSYSHHKIKIFNGQILPNIIEFEYDIVTEIEWAHKNHNNNFFLNFFQTNQINPFKPNSDSAILFAMNFLD